MSREYPERPLVGIGVVVLCEAGVLMVRRGKPPRQGDWSLPGGAQRLGETVAEAALREVAKETGLAVRLLGLVDVVDSVTRDDTGRVRYHYTLVDMAAVAAPDAPTPGGDAAEAAWVAADDLGGLALWSETRRVIVRALEMWKAMGRP